VRELIPDEKPRHIDAIRSDCLGPQKEIKGFLFGGYKVNQGFFRDTPRVSIRGSFESYFPWTESFV
jgi:hypothetical protein